MDPAELTVVAARAAIAAGELSPVELLESVRRGELEPSAALESLARLPFVDLPSARIDTGCPTTPPLATVA